MSEIAVVPAFKVYVWSCPKCKKENLVDEPYNENQVCGCGQAVIVGPLRGIARLKILVDSIEGPAPDLDDIAESAMFSCGVKVSRREHVKKVVMEAFRLTLGYKRQAKEGA